MTSREPLPLAITVGDASGVGPELALRAWADQLLPPNVVFYGPMNVLRKGAETLGLPIAIHHATSIDGLTSSTPSAPNSMLVVDVGTLSWSQHTPGQLSEAAGAAALVAVERATVDALDGLVAGVVTLPMNKEATQRSHPGFVGHTEHIARLCGDPPVTMMLTAGDLAVTHVSTHCSLAEAITRVQTPRVREVIELTHRTLRTFLRAPRIAVCGLNPHAGEHGLFGSEDEAHIAPAIADARASGIDATGPHPADTVFHAAVHQHRYDAIVCMYHDQGHGPMKLLAFETGVNVTIGLPIVRTSVDHGTAFDIAWKSIASPRSLVAAVAMAQRLTGGLSA